MVKQLGADTTNRRPMSAMSAKGLRTLLRGVKIPAAAPAKAPAPAHKAPAPKPDTSPETSMRIAGVPVIQPAPVKFSRPVFTMPPPEKAPQGPGPVPATPAPAPLRKAPRKPKNGSLVGIPLVWSGGTVKAPDKAPPVTLETIVPDKAPVVRGAGILIDLEIRMKGIRGQVANDCQAIASMLRAIGGEVLTNEVPGPVTGLLETVTRLIANRALLEELSRLVRNA